MLSGALHSGSFHSLVLGECFGVAVLKMFSLGFLTLSGNPLKHNLALLDRFCNFLILSLQCVFLSSLPLSLPLSLPSFFLFYSAFRECLQFDLIFVFSLFLFSSSLISKSSFFVLLEEHPIFVY